MRGGRSARSRSTAGRLAWTRWRGAPLSSFNRFTLYTPNTAAIIQEFLESKAVFDADSPTGFRKWNPEKLPDGAVPPHGERCRSGDR